MQRSDELWMEEALREAQLAQLADEVPVGAVVICEGRIVGRGSNRTIIDSDPTAHAEVVALRDAGHTMGNYRLSGCTLYATIEPCIMCAGAIVHARVDRLVYGAEDRKAGAVKSIMQVFDNASLNHRVEVCGGVLAAKCMDVIQNFFRARRNPM